MSQNDNSQSYVEQTQPPIQLAQNTSLNEKQDNEEEFLTFDKPIFGQFLAKDFSKDFYMEQVHKAKNLDYPARFFESDILESLTKTYWWTPPFVWFPAATIFLYICELSVVEKSAMWLFGFLLWTFLEYAFHRFVFHIEWALPDNKYFLILHFFTHAVHHFFPFDELRLAMPPPMFAILAAITWAGMNTFIATQPLLAMFSGIFVGFTLYDMFHFYLHHGAERSAFSHVRAMRTYHSIHHYKTPHLGYGVTSKLWDRVFGTLIPENQNRKSKLM